MVCIIHIHSDVNIFYFTISVAYVESNSHFFSIFTARLSVEKLFLAWHDVQSSTKPATDLSRIMVIFGACLNGYISPNFIILSVRLETHMTSHFSNKWNEPYSSECSRKLSSVFLRPFKKFDGQTKKYVTNPKLLAILPLQQPPQSSCFGVFRRLSVAFTDDTVHSSFQVCKWQRPRPVVPLSWTMNLL